DQIEQIGHGDELDQLLMTEPDLEAALDLRHNADHVHRVEPEPLAEVHAVVEVAVLFTRVGLEQLDERVPKTGTVRHDNLSRLGKSPAAPAIPGQVVRKRPRANHFPDAVARAVTW